MNEQNAYRVLVPGQKCYGYLRLALYGSAIFHFSALCRTVQSARSETSQRKNNDSKFKLRDARASGGKAALGEETAAKKSAETDDGRGKRWGSRRGDVAYTLDGCNGW